jgi:hypothetical protein
MLQVDASLAIAEIAREIDALFPAKPTPHGTRAHSSPHAHEPALTPARAHEPARTRACAKVREPSSTHG